MGALEVVSGNEDTETKSGVGQSMGCATTGDECCNRNIPHHVQHPQAICGHHAAEQVRLTQSMVTIFRRLSLVSLAPPEDISSRYLEIAHTGFSNSTEGVGAPNLRFHRATRTVLEMYFGKGSERVDEEVHIVDRLTQLLCPTHDEWQKTIDEVLEGEQTKMPLRSRKVSLPQARVM